MFEQLDLFNDQPAPKPARKRARPKLKVIASPTVAVPEARDPEPFSPTLVPFPASRHVRVVDLAYKLRGLRDDEDRNDAWRAALKIIRVEMLSAGLMPEVVKVEMQRFADAVRAVYWNPGAGQPQNYPTRTGA